jgi:hypothetical protein
VKHVGLRAGGARGDDGRVHPSVVALPLEEKGYVVAALLARTPAASVRERLAGASGARCAEALEALGAASKPVRASALAALIALVRAPVPAGLERIHPDWLKERFARETGPVLRAVVADLSADVKRIAEAVLAARGQAAVPPAAVDGEGVAALRRSVFAGFVPLVGPGAPAGPVARALLELGSDGLTEAIARRGAETIGASLHHAPAPVIARAAAALGSPLGERVIEAAAREDSPAARDAARAIVAAATAGTPAEKLRAIGLRALAAALCGEGPSAAVAVAQRLPPPLGRELLAAAGLAGAL